MISVALLATATSAVTLSAANAEVFRLGHIRDTNHPTHEAALKFKELVEQKSDGEIEIRVYPNSQLGGAKEMFVQLQTGDLEMVYGGINTFAWIDGGEAFEVTSIPFLFRDYDHMKKSLESEVFAPVIEEAEEETGIKIVAFGGDTSPRGLTTADTPVETAEDFKGLKIRTAASPAVLTAMQALGAMPQQIPFSELYMALRTGVVDAQENGAAVVASNSLYEVQNYYIKTDYIRDIDTFFMAMDKWDDLSSDEQALITDAALEAGMFGTEQLNALMADVYEDLGEKMTVIEPDLGSIRDALSGAFDQFEGDKWPNGLIEQISSVQ
ncbi:TRAP transporter substrate-binding protein [Martelella radicis]|nr:TRAP transporter substrate-binding protein [Martelella radicis]